MDLWTICVTPGREFYTYVRAGLDPGETTCRRAVMRVPTAAATHTASHVQRAGGVLVASSARACARRLSYLLCVDNSPGVALLHGLQLFQASPGSRCLSPGPGRPHG